MRVIILGLGNIGSWLANILQNREETFIFDVDPIKYNQFTKVNSIESLHDINCIKPDLIINAVPLGDTIKVFDEVMSLGITDYLFCDVCSIKGSLKKYYQEKNARFVSFQPGGRYPRKQLGPFG